MDTRKIELLRKLKYRVEHSPDSPERENARRMLADRMARWGVTESELGGYTVRKMEAANESEWHILLQCLTTRLHISLEEGKGARGLESYTLRGSKKYHVDIALTDDEYGELVKVYRYYLDEYRRRERKFKKEIQAKVKSMKSAFFYAFLDQAKLLSEAKEGETDSGKPEWSLADLMSALNEYSSDPLAPSGSVLEDETSRLGYDGHGK